MLIYSQIAREKSCDYLLIIYVQKFQTNSWLFVFILPCGVNTLHLKESDWSKHLSTCLYFVACFYFSVWHYPLTLNEDIVALTKPVRHFFFGTVFQGTCQSFLISSFCTNFVFLHSKNFKFLHCLGLIDMLSANQNAEIFVCVCILLSVSDTLSDIRELKQE